MAEDKPPEHPTVKLESPPAWAIEMSLKMQDGFKELRTSIGNVGDEVTSLRSRVSLIETKTNDLEMRASSASLRVRGVSQDGLEHDAQLAQERAAREALSAKVETIDAKVETIDKKADAIAAETGTQTAMLRELSDGAKKFLAHPAVKYAAAAIWTAIVAYAARKGISLQ